MRQNRISVLVVRILISMVRISFAMVHILTLMVHILNKTSAPLKNRNFLDLIS